MSFRGPARVLSEPANDRPLAVVVAAGQKCRRVEIAEADGSNAAGFGNRHGLASEREPHQHAPRVGKVVGHRVVRQRGGEQHRAIGELAPQVAPDVAGEDSIRFEHLQ